MKKLIHYILTILFLVLIGEMVLMSPSEIKEPGRAKDATTKGRMGPDDTPKEVDQIMRGVHVVESKSESREWELWAEMAMGIKQKGDMLLKKIKANFFADSGVQFDVLGEEGAVRSETKDMTVSGGVTTTSSNGYVFRSQELKYNSQARTLKSPTPVEVTGPRDANGHILFIKGAKMDADLGQGIVVIDQDVKAQKSVRDNRKMSVTADKVQLSGRERAVKFSGNVVIQLEGFKISGPDAYLRYDNKTSQLTSIDLEGGVRVSDVSKLATSERLSINLAKNEYIFDGQPRIIQDKDEVMGDRIVFVDGGKQVQVKNAKIRVSKESIKSHDLKGKK